MPTYTCKTTGRLFVQFNYKGQTVKRRLQKGATKADGKELEAELKHLLFADSNGLERKAEMLWEEFVQTVYLEYVEANQPQASLDRAIVVLRTSMPFLKGKTFRQIKAADLERWKAVRLNTPTRHGKPRMASTVHREFNVLSAVFSMALDNDLCELNPCKKVKLPKFDNVQDKVLHVEDIDRFLRAFRNSLQRDIAQTVIYTGLRQNDVLGLRKEHIDLRNDEIRLTQGKTKRRVGIPIEDAIRPMLESRIDKYDDLLFPSYRTGKRLWSIKNGIRFACIRAGIPVLTIRDLRRTYGTLLHDDGVDDKTVADLLGHADTRCVHRYKRGSKSKKRAIQRLGKNVKRASLSASDSEEPISEGILALAKLLQGLGLDVVEMRRIELLASALRRQSPTDGNTLTYSQID